MFCQCAPPWLPLYPLFEPKQSIKKILLIVVECFRPTLALICLDFVSNIMRLLGFKNLLVLAKYNTHNLFLDHVELNSFDN
jgi:hypothetical protein